MRRQPHEARRRLPAKVSISVSPSGADPRSAPSTAPPRTPPRRVESATTPPPTFSTASPSGIERQRADRHVERRPPVRRRPADRPAIGLARPGLELADDLHRPELRRPGHRAAGKERREDPRQRRPRHAAARSPATPSGARSRSSRPRRAPAPAPSRSRRSARCRCAAGRRSSGSRPGSSGPPPAPPPAARRAPASGSRGAVPFIGRASIPPAPSSAKKSSGERDTQRRARQRHQRPVPDRLAAPPAPRCDRRRLAAASGRRSGSVRFAW